jgi:hypothetical protein
LINHRYQAKIPLFHRAMFVWSNSEEVEIGQSLAIQDRLGLLPFPH